MSDWTHIELRTPALGVPVLAYDGRQVIVAALYRGDVWLSAPGRYAVHPTHWQPLPDEPQRHRPFVLTPRKNSPAMNRH